MSKLTYLDIFILYPYLMTNTCSQSMCSLVIDFSWLNIFPGLQMFISRTRNKVCCPCYDEQYKIRHSFIISVIDYLLNASYVPITELKLIIF